MKTILFTIFLLFGLTGCGGGGSTSSDETKTDEEQSSNSDVILQNGKYTLLAWNDLGMHCIDGKDYSVFSILPPYNNLNAQLIKKDGTENKHIKSGITLTYESEKGLNNSINTTSIGKTNFWDYVLKLFGTNLANDVGLTGNKTPSTAGLLHSREVCEIGD